MCAVECKKPMRHFERLWYLLILELRLELRLERACGAGAKPLAALAKLLVEGLFVYNDALQQLSAMEIERLADRGKRTATD